MVVVTETGSVTVVVGKISYCYRCRGQYMGFFAAMDVTDGAIVPAGYTYRTRMECIRVGERLATMAIDRDGGGFRCAINCFGGTTVVATSGCCGSSGTMFAGRGRSEEESYDAREED